MGRDYAPEVELRPVSELAARTEIPVASVSQHLNRLAIGGIVARRRQGTSVMYRVADDTIAALCDLVCSSLPVGPELSEAS